MTSRRTALVTGCGSPSGIGFATAKRLAAAGYDVAITSTTDRIHERAEELRALAASGAGTREASGDVLSIVADLTHESDVAMLVDETTKRFGRIDALVNNAGMVTVGNELFNAPLSDTTLQQWNDSLARNLTSCFLVTRRVLGAQVAGGAAMPDGGRIVNVASTTGALQAASATWVTTRPRRA